MDVEVLKAEIDGHIGRITDPPKQNDLRRDADSTYAQFQAATDPAEKTRLTRVLEGIRSEAERVAPPQNAGGGPNGPGGSAGGGSGGGSADGGGQFLSKGGFILVLLLTVLSFGFLFYFVERMVKHELNATESVQFLIVLTLILSMLAFGGLLIIRAMFAPYPREELENRFRMGREVFVVFSSVFGTIIGFYFGVTDEDDAEQQTPTVEVSFANDRVTATVSGGAEPYIGIFTPAGANAGQLMTVDGPILVSPARLPVCPQGATVLVVDSEGERVEEEIDCGGDGEARNDAAATPANSAGNAAANAQ